MSRESVAVQRILAATNTRVLFAKVRVEMEKEMRIILDEERSRGRHARQQFDAAIISRKAELWRGDKERSLYGALKAAEQAIRDGEMPV